MNNELNLKEGRWLFEPQEYSVQDDSVVVKTDPFTDFWQRSYYGVRNDNAPALLFDSNKNFTFTVKVRFDYKKQYDQCGVIIFLDSENWFKASIEFENADYSRLGSVVTNILPSRKIVTRICALSHYIRCKALIRPKITSLQM